MICDELNIKNNNMIVNTPRKKKKAVLVKKYSKNYNEKYFEYLKFSCSLVENLILKKLESNPQPVG